MNAPATDAETARGAWRRARAAGALAAVAAPGTFTLYLVFTLTGGALPVTSAWLTKLVIDNLVAGAPLDTLIAIAVALGMTGAIIAITPQVTRYLRAELERTVGTVAQDRLFLAVEGFVGLSRFEDPRFLDRLRIAQQAGGHTPNQAIDGILGAGRSVLTIGGFVGSLFLLSPIMTVLVLLSGIPTLVAQMALSRQRARMFWDIGPAQRREIFYGQLLTDVTAAKEIRGFGIGAFLRGRMSAQRHSANMAQRVVDRREVRVQTGLSLLAAVVSGGGLVWAVWTARSGGLTIGDITIFAAAVLGVQNALATLAAEVARAHQALLMFSHYLAVTTAGPDLPVAAAPRALPPMRRGIELRDVWFRYSDEHPWALRGVSVTIPHGRAIALVGLNGAGKSTLVKLLCRLYDPTRGTIRWDGVDIRDVDPTELRRRISAMFQDYMDYDMTAAENIGLGDLSSLRDRDRITAAARRAGVHDRIIELPDGYDTMLSRVFFTESDKDDPDTGVVLSGGQWQRLALARALLRDRCDLMILDEPSAGLDAQAEHEIHTSLRRHRAGRTSLLISHRLGAVRDADEIVVLHDGQVVERGDHDALLRAGGEYARLFTLQASGYQAAV